MASLHRNTAHRAGAGQTSNQLLSATGDHTRCGGMHTPAPSRCVFHRTDGRRAGRGNQDQFDACPEALRFKHLTTRIKIRPSNISTISSSRIIALSSDAPARFLATGSK